MNINAPEYDVLRSALIDKLSSKAWKEGMSWWEIMLEFFMLAIPFIIALLKGGMADPKPITDFLTSLWMEYCNVAWLPDWIEEKIIREIIAFGLGIIIGLFQKGLIK